MKLLYIFNVCVCVCEDEPIILNRKRKFGSGGMKEFNAGFEFGESDGVTEETWLMSDVLSQLKKKVRKDNAEVFRENFRKQRRKKKKKKRISTNEFLCVECLQRSLTTLDQKIEKIRKKRKAEVSFAPTLVCSPASASRVHPVLFWNRQEKAPGSLPSECARGKSGDGGEEEDEQPPEGTDEDCDESEEEEDEFDSSDEEILTKSGGCKLILWMDVGLLLLFGPSEVKHLIVYFCFFLVTSKFHFLPFRRHSPRQTTTGEEEGGEEDEVLRLQLSQLVQGYHGYCCVLQGPESFFEDASEYNDQLTFDDMNLSRPILKVPPLV